MTEASNVLKLKVATKPSKAKKASRAAVRQAKQQLLAGAAVSVVGLALTGLSLKHLAHGINVVTNADMWECAAMAVGIDLGFVALELAQMSVTDKLRSQINRYANPTIVGTMVGSAVLNAFAFSSGVVGLMKVPAVALGLVIPVMIWSLMKVGSKMYRG